jgi:hypothetical protein
LPFAGHVEAWAALKGLSGVVWTALKPGFVGGRGVAPSLDKTRTYLLSLDDQHRVIASRYVKMAPRQIETPFRSSLEAALNVVPGIGRPLAGRG